MRFMKIVALLLATAFCCAGCGTKKPADVPNLESSSIKIVKSGAPVVNANVFLKPAEGTPSGSWSVVGLTDSTGLAKITTTQGEWVGDGAPAGEYIVYITKVPQIEEPERPADFETNDAAKNDYYAERLKRLEAAKNEIPEALTLPTTSGLTFTVAKGAQATIDVDAPAAE